MVNLKIIEQLNGSIQIFQQGMFDVPACQEDKKSRWLCEDTSKSTPGRRKTAAELLINPLSVYIYVYMLYNVMCILYYIYVHYIYIYSP